MLAVMVGGPLHGQTRNFPDPLPPQWIVPRIVSVFDLATETDPLPKHHRYELRWYDHNPQPQRQQPAYLCMDPAAAIRLSAHPSEEEIYNARVAKSLWYATQEALLPTCVAPNCTEKGRLTFTAAENGRLAGRTWKYGDQIRVCPNHGHDIYLAQASRGYARLADWLQADATWDPLDAYDGGSDLLYGAEILERTARMLHLAHHRTQER